MSPGTELPCHIEMWGYEVVTIRRFDPETQHSIAPADGVRIVNVHEKLPQFCDPDTFAERHPINLSDCRTDAVSTYLPALPLPVD